MNAFYEHHRDSIRFGDGFFATYRHLYPVSRDVLRGAAEQFQCWAKGQADKWNAPRRWRAGCPQPRQFAVSSALRVGG